MKVSFRAGDTAYIVESERIVRGGKIIKCTGGFYLLRFFEGGGIRVKEHRLYHTEKDAQDEITRIHVLRNTTHYYGEVKIS